MPDKNGNPIRGEPGHFRYNKDMASGNKFDTQGNLIAHGPPVKIKPGEGTTGMDTPGIKGTDLPKAGIPDPKGIFTKSVAKGFNKTEQKNLLKARGVKVLSRDTEAKLVEKILKSNPEGAQSEAEPDAPPESPEETGETAPNKPEGYSKEELGNFKSKKLVEILKGLGVKKIPMTEKGRIKKILETQ